MKHLVVYFIILAYKRSLCVRHRQYAYTFFYEHHVVTLWSNLFIGKKKIIQKDWKVVLTPVVFCLYINTSDSAKYKIWKMFCVVTNKYMYTHNQNYFMKTETFYLLIRNRLKDTCHSIMFPTLLVLLSEIA